MEENQLSYAKLMAADVVATLADQVGEDTPLPERIVIQQVSEEVYVVRFEVRDDDQPHGFTFTVR